VLFLCLALAAGCQPVREDRTITWSGQGNAVGFQHGKEGVFVADREGGGLQKIFQPGDDVLATSPPLWAPSDGRLIFTTARGTQPATTVSFQLGGESDPAGRVFAQQPVTYTCWLRDEARNGEAPKPVALFEAACDHVGYVAANLAVRWHPQGNRILYVKEVSSGRHGLFEFDLATKACRQVFSHTSQALTFEWTPDGTSLVCVLGGSPAEPATDGIWIGPPDAADWWHVPDSAALAEGQLPSLLEQLRATQPAWTPDGTRFAFVSCTAPLVKEQPIRHFLCLATLATHEVTVVTAEGESFRDLHWSPDGSRLGVVQGGETGVLRLLEADGALSDPINRRPVRHFAGWQRDSDRLAYVVPDRVPLSDEPRWAFLFVPVPLARDAVLVADGRGADGGEEVLSGMRVTFPHWSPKEDKLSLWATFSPTYHSPFSELVLRMALGVRRGDPAAVFDTTTGRLGWMAVDAHEQVQVGHYYLLKRDYAEAWRWYERAEKGQPPAPTEPSALTMTNLQEFLGARDFSVFAYYCLEKLGRHEEAKARLARFRRTYLHLPEKDEDPWLNTKIGERSVGQWLRDALEPEKLTGALLRDLYVAEVFLSVDAAEDGERFFRQGLANAPTDTARLSRALVLAQFLLLEKKHAAYADLTTGTIVPLLFRAQEKLAHTKPGMEQPSILPMLDLTVAVYAGGAVLLPLGTSEFLTGLPDQQLHALLTRWRAVRAEAQDDWSRIEADVVLHATYQRLGLEKERLEVAKRLEQERGPDQNRPLSETLHELVEQLRRGTPFLPH
jgi:hypothetical protein